MRSIKFKKTFVFRVALASVLSLLMSFSSLCYTNSRIETLEARLQNFETAQQSQALGSFDLELGLFKPTESVSPTSPTAEDELRSFQTADISAPVLQLGPCDNAGCVDF